MAVDFIEKILPNPNHLSTSSIAIYILERSLPPQDSQPMVLDCCCKFTKTLQNLQVA